MKAMKSGNFKHSFFMEKEKNESNEIRKFQAFIFHRGDKK